VAGRECYHCKQWVEEGEPHDCWTTTETALTADLSEDLREAWERLRETAAEFGDQRIYASHNSIMFARKACYFFVRPKKSFLEVCVFLGRPLKVLQVRRSEASSKSKFYSIIQLRHRDEVEAPITDWLREAYEFADPGREIADPGRGGSLDPPEKGTKPARRAGSSEPPNKAKKSTRREASVDAPEKSKRSTARARKTKRTSSTKRAKRN
jgi:uncharacterized protein DUF5655